MKIVFEHDVTSIECFNLQEDNFDHDECYISLTQDQLNLFYTILNRSRVLLLAMFAILSDDNRTIIHQKCFYLGKLRDTNTIHVMICD
jgi:hypothetical protein